MEAPTSVFSLFQAVELHVAHLLQAYELRLALSQEQERSSALQDKVCTVGILLVYGGIGSNLAVARHLKSSSQIASGAICLLLRINLLFANLTGVVFFASRTTQLEPQLLELHNTAEAMAAKHAQVSLQSAALN
jgi:hypothetical protein